MPGRPKLFRPRHSPAAAAQAAASAAQRGSARDRGYTAQWDAAAKAFRRSHPLCLGCRAIGRVTATGCVDHTVPHKGDGALFWDRHNWQPACNWHHQVVKQKLELLFDQGKAKASDLRLDSPMAVALTRDLLGLE
jgi:5-methylcytosine-specific restriction protein A